MEKYIHFWAERCRKYALFQKKLQISFSASNFGQKSPRGHTSIFPRNGARDLER